MCIPNSYGQRKAIRFRHVTIEEGLSQNSASCITQDTMGFMWIGTQAGLNKYDGYTFTIYKSHTYYTSNTYNTSSISENHILCLCKDKQGSIWIGTENGLNKYNYDLDNFTRYFHDPNNPKSISGKRVYSIFAETGRLWVGTNNGACTFDLTTKSFTPILNDTTPLGILNKTTVKDIIVDKSGLVWIGTADKGVICYDENRVTFTHYQQDDQNPNSLNDNVITAIYEGAYGYIWIGTEKGGLNRYDKKVDGFKHFKHDPQNQISISDNHILAIQQDNQGMLWIGTNNGGISFLNPKSNDLEIYANNPERNINLGDNKIYSIFKDNSGNMWIGTGSRGAGIYNQEGKKFSHYANEFNNENSLSDNIVWEIIEDHRGDIWICTDRGGLNKLDRKNNRFTHYKHDKNNPTSISSNMTVVVYEDRMGHIWSGGNEGLNCFDPKKKTFKHYKHDPKNSNSLSNNKIRSLHEDALGYLWIGTRGGGLNRFDRHRDIFTHYRHDPSDSTSISSDFVYLLYEDQFNNFWVGSYGSGLNKFYKKTGTFKQYSPDKKDGNCLNNNYVSSVYEDSSGILWIGTMGGGLNRFDLRKETFTYFTEEQGLSNNEIYCILGDNNGNLWLSTNRGISKFNPETEHFKNYRVEDGLTDDEFNMFAACRLTSGEMIFGGIKGLNVFHPDSMRDNPIPPSVHITNFMLSNRMVPVGQMSDGRTILDKSIAVTKDIFLSFRDRVISFEFTALHFTAPEKNQYAYMMEGLEKDWNYVGTRRFVTYSNLPPGNYVFKVKASNSDDVWNDEGKSLAIHIKPPIWQTWWFYVLCVLSLLFALRILYKWRISDLEERRKELEFLVRERTQQLEEANEELKNLATIDKLTGLSNRRKFDEYYSLEWRRSVREAKALTIIMIDVDYFKLFNDTYGHQAGDKCLKKIAKLLRRTSNRAGDIVARYGGEEFVVVLSEANKQVAYTVSSAIKKMVKKLKIQHSKSPINKYVTVSIGCASIVPSKSIKPADLLKAADDALYTSKEEGRNRVTVSNISFLLVRESGKSQRRQSQG